MDCVLLDFSKAFDKVPHRRLLHKLKYYGVGEKTLNWIASFLQNRTQTVLVNGKTSTETPVLSGVPQGTVLGPLLFLAYINDMPDCVTSQIKLFADDSLLYARISGEEDAVRLQEDLNRLTEWEETWMMHFHPAKCETLRITNKVKPINYDYYIHNHKLSLAIDHIPKSKQEKARQRATNHGERIHNTAKHLGININSKLSWNHHVDAITKKANSTLAFLRRNTSNCPKPVKSYCYETYVRPTLEYASTVWDPTTKHNINKMEMVQRRAARYVHSDWRRHSSPTEMMNQLQWQTLEHRRHTARLTMMYTIQHNLIDIPLNKYTQPARTHCATEHLAAGRRGHPLQLRVQRSRLQAYKHSFFISTIEPWNKLTVQTINAPSIEAFK